MKVGSLLLPKSLVFTNDGIEVRLSKGTPVSYEAFYDPIIGFVIRMNTGLYKAVICKYDDLDDARINGYAIL